MSVALLTERFLTSGSKTVWRWLQFLTIWLAPAFATALLHLRSVGLIDTPGSTPISLGQAATAMIANAFGPWAGHIVATVDFPNAGLRSFNGYVAVALTLIYFTSAVAVTLTEQRVPRLILIVQFVILTMAWYGYGFYLIADGLL